MKAAPVNTVVFKLDKIEQRNFFGSPGIFKTFGRQFQFRQLHFVYVVSQMTRL